MAEKPELQILLRTASSSIDSSFNVETIYNGPANNNTTITNNHFHLANEQFKKVKQLESPVIVDQTAQNIEVIQNDKKIMELIWEYLSIEDKLNCTLVCKRFNKIVSEMECFPLFANLSSRYRVIPRLTRVYKKAIFKKYKCKSLQKPTNYILDYLSSSLIDLKFDFCSFNLMTLHEIIVKFKHLESLDLNIAMEEGEDVELFSDETPKLSQLLNLNINIDGTYLEECLNMLESASNVQSLSLSNAIMNTNVFHQLKQYQKSLTSLILTKCVVDADKIFHLNNLNTLCFDSIEKLELEDYSCFRKLKNLRVLHFTNCGKLEIFQHIHQVTDLGLRLQDLHLRFLNITSATLRFYVYNSKNGLLEKKKLFFSRWSPTTKVRWKIYTLLLEIGYPPDNVDFSEDEDFNKYEDEDVDDHEDANILNMILKTKRKTKFTN